MRISRAWLRDYVELPQDLSPGQLAHELTLKTVEVERIEQADDDVVLEIDNKSLTNRPDLWGHFGIARELAAILRLELVDLPRPGRPERIAGLVEGTDPDLSARFAAVSFDLPTAMETPQWIAARLRRVGLYSGSFLLDLSNYVMLTTGQPNCVYDRDMLALPLTVQVAPDERFAGDADVDVEGLLTVRDRRGAVGLAGVVSSEAARGGPESVRCLLEVASFPALAVRRASQRTGVRTEASARYEKAIDTQRVDDAIDLFLGLLVQEAPGTTFHGMQDLRLADTERTTVVTPRSFLDSRIGEVLPSAYVADLLDRLGFDVDVDDTEVRTTSPSWRSTGDISLPNDILEEVARLHGYDELPTADIEVTLRPVRALNRIPVERRVRECLAREGRLNEVITYPWVTSSTAAATGDDTVGAVTFAGAPAPDRGSLRRALLPNLLEAIQLNLHHRRDLALFEVGTVFDGSTWSPYGGRHESMPTMSTSVGVVLTGGDGAQVFRRLAGIVDLLKSHGWVSSLEIRGDTTEPWADASARARLAVDGATAGAVALLRPAVLHALGIHDLQVGHLCLDLSAVSMHGSRSNAYKPVSDLPVSRFDLSVVVADGVRWAGIENVVRESDERVTDVQYLGDFRGSWVPAAHRSVSFRVTLTPGDHTFSAEEIHRITASVVARLGEFIGARLREQLG